MPDFLKVFGVAAIIVTFLVFILGGIVMTDLVHQGQTTWKHAINVLGVTSLVGSIGVTGLVWFIGHLD